MRSLVLDEEREGPPVRRPVGQFAKPRDRTVVDEIRHMPLAG